MSPVGRVADVQRHRFGRAFLHVGLGLVERDVGGVRLRRQRQVERRLGERQLALRRAEEVVRLLGGQRERERPRVGVADVLGREAHEPARDVERILAGVEHARHPVERGVGVGVAQRLVQRRDEVVVLLARSCRRAASCAARPRGSPPRSPRGAPPAGGASCTASSRMFSAERASPLASRAIEPQRVVGDLGRQRRPGRARRRPARAA